MRCRPNRTFPPPCLLPPLLPSVGFVEHPELSHVVCTRTPDVSCVYKCTECILRTICRIPLSLASQNAHMGKCGLVIRPAALASTRPPCPLHDARTVPTIWRAHAEGACSSLLLTRLRAYGTRERLATHMHTAPTKYFVHTIPTSLPASKNGRPLPSRPCPSCLIQPSWVTCTARLPCPT